MRGLPSIFSKKKTTNHLLPTTMGPKEGASTKYPDVEFATVGLAYQANGSRAEGADDQSLSLGAFVKVTNNLLEVNQQIAKLIMLSEEDVRKDKGFLSLVNLFLESCYMILELSNALESCFGRVKQSMLITLYIVKQFECDQAEMESHEFTEENNKCKSLVEDLKEFKAAGGDPFNDEFLRLCILVNELEVRNKHIHVWQELNKLNEIAETTFDEELNKLFTSVHKQQQKLCEKLHKQEAELLKKLRRIKIWKLLSNIVFAIGFFSVPVLTAVVLAVTVPSAVEVLIGAFSATIGSIGKWCSYSWNKHERAAKEQKDKIRSINMSIYVNMKDMEDMRRRVSILADDVKSLMGMAELTLKLAEEEKGDGVVKYGIAQIKKSLDASLRNVVNAALQASLCGKSITVGRDMVSRKLNKDTSKRQNWLEILM